tara:strand:+ start:2380 stop:3546 length:1167 start_codon:yes stop_codon:yes gene_type:complete
MSTQQISLLMNRQVGGVMMKAKEKIINEGKKMIKQKILSELPSKDEIIEKLISAACSISAQKKMEKIYNKLHGLIEKLENILLKAKGKLDAINAKIKKITDGILPKIAVIFGILAVIITVVEIIMIIAKLSMNLLVAMFSHGGLQQKLAVLIARAFGVVGEFGGAIKSGNKAAKKYLKMAMGIVASIVGAVLLIQPILTFVQKIKAFIEYLYLMYISMCNTSDTSVMDSEGNINESLLKSEILKNDPTGIYPTPDIKQFVNDLGIGEGTGVDGTGTGTGTNTGTGTGNGMNIGGGWNTGGGLETGNGIGANGNQGLPTYGGTGTGVNGLEGNNSNLLSISEQLTLIYKDLILELEGQGKKEIVEHLNNLDFGFQTRFERKIVPITPTN